MQFASALFLMLSRPHITLDEPLLLEAHATKAQQVRLAQCSAPQVPARQEAGAIGADAEPGDGAARPQKRERERVGRARTERGWRRRSEHHRAGRPALADQLEEDLAPGRRKGLLLQMCALPKASGRRGRQRRGFHASQTP